MHPTLYNKPVTPDGILTWLLALGHITATATQETHHVLGGGHFLLAGANPPPHKHGIGRFKHKHVIGIQEGSGGLYLTGRKRQEVFRKGLVKE